MARGAAAAIFTVIDRKSKIDPMSGDGKIINYGVKGDIEFEDVAFHYPSRTDVPILNHLSAKFINGQTVALVGSSGNGKVGVDYTFTGFFLYNLEKYLILVNLPAITSTIL